MLELRSTLFSLPCFIHVKWTGQEKRVHYGSQGELADEARLNVRFGPTINGFLKMAGKESWWLSHLACKSALMMLYH